ncbi:AMP-binding protein [Desulforhopalus singaporensis]|uniref:Fatty-acyl-CoA synthase n=1 Tax=Desulforhopalus singaporensis TaxID=91360 RepID=A0A1H0LBX5_9BACT|nr:fatty-acyl-CoA synthase [Desulforhopalus singaporensis]
MTRETIVREATLGQILAETVEKYPDQTAVAYVDREYSQTWREFGETVDTIAKGLMAMGVKRGEKVAVWATNVPHWVALQFATARIGAILLTINTNYRSEEIDYVLKQSDCENIFIMNGLRDANYLEIMYELVPELKTHPRGQLRSSRYPSLKRVFFLGPEKHRGVYSIAEVMSLAVATADEEYRERQDCLDPDDVINMQYTSGTTGFPKGVMLTHNNIGNNGYWLGAGQNMSHRDKVCIPVPLFHCFGCVLGVLACVNHGAAMVFVETFDPVQVMMSIEMEKCTAVYGVPTMFMAMLDNKLFDKFDFSSLRTGIMAGSPCPVKTMNDLISRMNMTEVTIVFGLTEASPGMTQTMYNEPSIRKKCETVGKAMPGIEVKIIDTETGEDLPPGEPGEVVCRGYNVMKGYYKMEEATRETIDDNGFLHTGDIGMIDEDGYFAITGRIKDMIIRGGENIYPKEVEDFLHHMEGVKDVQVVGVPSSKYGEQPGAFVVPYPGADITPQDVIDYCQGKIAWYKTPKYVYFVDDFPLTASGKVRKIELRERSSELWPDA